MVAKKKKTNKKSKSAKSVRTTLARQDDGTIQITLSFPYELVKKTREEALEHLIEDLEVPGFRKGKAPKDVAQEKIDKQELFNHTLQHLLPEAYSQAVEEHKLEPILAPRFELVSVEEGKDWVIRAITCEVPETELGDYKKTVSGAARAQGIWVPGKDKKKEPSREEKEQAVIKALLESVSVKIPKILIEEEVNHKLSQLLQQVQNLGLTVEQYLSSSGKNVEQIKAEYAKQAEDAIKLEIALNQVAENEGVKVEDKEVEEVIASTGDERTKKALSTPQQKRVIHSVLRRRKALDRLISFL